MMVGVVEPTARRSPRASTLERYMNRRGLIMAPIVNTLLVQAAIAASEDAEGPLCEFGPTTRDTLFSLGGATVTTIVAGLILVQTLAASLAASGYRQASANAAAFGLAAFFGGSVGTAIMAFGDCSVTNVPGGVSLGMAMVGLCLALFSFATGRA
jgi:hypothetical protein